MNKKNKRFLPAILAAGISMGCSAKDLQSKPLTENATYEIYPRPQAVKYEQKSFRISDSVNVVFERGIDDYTKVRLAEILKRTGIEFSTSDKPAPEKTNILVGINNSGGLVDRYFNKSVAHPETFFDKTDAHIISVNDPIIAVLGADPDSAFYGITTLKHVFNQIENRQIREFRIDDFAHVKHRGFIEGYYGNPWSNEDRAELMKFGGDYKLNTYFFAPKDDIYHNAKWRELYPEKELAEIRKLARVGNATKNKYVYALHTFMHNPVRFDSDSVYKNDLGIIKAKFSQLLENDVRAFSILADDAGVPRQGPESYVKLLRDLTDWLIEQKKSYPDLVTDITFCPNDYMGNGSSAQLREVNKAPDSVAIIMTGGRIWGEVSEQFTSDFIQNIASGGAKGRPAYLWINWPCSDNSKQHLIMGGNDTFLHPGVNPYHIRGIILNPMQQAEANKSALFAIADYGWNIWSNIEQANQNWYDSFKYMDHGTAEETKPSTALRTIAQHMINQNMDGRVRVLQESVELAPKLNDLKKKLQTDTLKKGDTATLLQEFAALNSAAAAYKQNPGNERTRDQIIYWLNCWEDTTTAAINYLNCLDAVIDGDNETIWRCYSTAQAAFEKSKTYKFHYVNHYEYAEVGVQHIVPFIKTMGQHLNEIVAGIIDPSRVVETFISNREDMPEGNLNSLLKGPAKSGVVYKSPARIAAGEYVGVRYSNPKQITSIEFQLGTPSNPSDTFSAARIEITQDGKVWTPLNHNTYTLPNAAKVENLDITVRGIRMIATEAKNDTWLGVRGIMVNGGQGAKTAGHAYTNTKLDLSTKVTLEQAELEPKKRITLKEGEYIGIKLDRIKDLKAITGDINTRQLTLQVSANGVEWAAITSKELPAARYIRILNQTNQNVTFDMNRFEVHSNEILPISYVEGHANIHNNSKAEQAFDGDFNTTVIFDKGFNAGETIVYDFGQIIPVDNLKYVVLDTESDHIRDAKFQLSLDGKTWKDVFETTRKSDDNNAKPQDNGYKHGSLSQGIIPISHAYLEGEKLNTKARFFRILATRAYQPRWVRISEVLINNGSYIPSSNNPTFVSKPIELKGHGPENMLDGDLTTSYRPDTKDGRIKSGSIIYKLSENTEVGQINIVQDGNSISNAKVLVRADENNQWSPLGELSKSLNELSTKQHKHIFEIKLEWEGVAPTIYQIVTIPTSPAKK